MAGEKYARKGMKRERPRGYWKKRAKANRSWKKRKRELQPGATG